MTWPILLCIPLAALALLAVASMALTWIYWKSIGQHVNDLWVKIATKGIQLLAAAASLGGAYAVGQDKQEWLLPTTLGVACVALWEVVGQLIENRVKSADKADKGALERAEVQSELRTRLLTVFRFAVDGKARRVRRQIERRGANIRMPQVRNSLTPEPHLGELLQNLAVFFQQQLPAGDGENRNFRVGLYVNRAGVMTPVQAISLNDSSYTPFRSYEAHQGAFRLEAAQNPSHVVVCVRQKRMIVVEDCAGAAERGEFSYFRDDQRGYLRSMVAYYLGEVCQENGTISEGALAIDTEAAGFFKDTDRDFLEFCLREFGARLRLEMLLIALLTTPQRTNP
jgi:hypothetical protein